MRASLHPWVAGMGGIPASLGSGDGGSLHPGVVGIWSPELPASRGSGEGDPRAPCIHPSVYPRGSCAGNPRARSILKHQGWRPPGFSIPGAAGLGFSRAPLPSLGDQGWAVPVPSIAWSAASPAAFSSTSDGCCLGDKSSPRRDRSRYPVCRIFLWEGIFPRECSPAFPSATSAPGAAGAGARCRGSGGAGGSRRC